MKTRAQVLEDFDGRLRARLKTRMRFCPTCGRSTLSLRTVAKAAGVSLASLSRFLLGAPPSESLADGLAKFLDQEGR